MINLLLFSLQAVLGFRGAATQPGSSGSVSDRSPRAKSDGKFYTRLARWANNGKVCQQAMAFWNLEMLASAHATARAEDKGFWRDPFLTAHLISALLSRRAGRGGPRREAARGTAPSGPAAGAPGHSGSAGGRPAVGQRALRDEARHGSAAVHGAAEGAANGGGHRPAPPGVLARPEGVE